MKVLYILLGIVGIVVFSGCSCKNVPGVKCETIYVDREVKVNVPIKCKTPDTFCDDPGSLKKGTMNELLGCVYELRESTKVCKG